MSEESASLDFDVLIVGSGVAGAAAALHLSAQTGARVGLVTKAKLSESATLWAQGGIAMAVSTEHDSVDLHFSDTVRAGAGLCDEAATSVLVEEAPQCLADLSTWGAHFDRTDDGDLALAREGGHSVARVVHAGGAATGAEVIRAVDAALRQSDVTIVEDCFVLDLCVEDGRCTGVSYLDKSGALGAISAGAVVLSTGGAGQLFSVTTNPVESTADGLAMALRAGVPVADVEFMQFHPTALVAPISPRPLLSEALRGYGATLRNEAGERFVDELAPRDVVSRAIADQMTRDGTDHVFLDATELDDFRGRFPTIAKVLSALGIDPTKEQLPVAPAAHYLSGGVLTDLDGASALPGLFAVGEVACSGVQGANRLASNSLLEGLVFGRRVARALSQGRDRAKPTGALAGWLCPKDANALPVRALPEEHPWSDGAIDDQVPLDVDAARRLLQGAMSQGAGVVRDATGLQVTGAVLDRALAVGHGAEPSARQAIEVENLATVGAVIVEAALFRTESRGCHYRSDYPERDDKTLRCRLAVASRVPRRDRSGMKEAHR